MHDLCLVEGLSAPEIEKLSGMVKTRRRVRLVRVGMEQFARLLVDRAA